jgi:hypothetical protein
MEVKKLNIKHSQLAPNKNLWINFVKNLNVSDIFKGIGRVLEYPAPS